MSKFKHGIPLHKSERLFNDKTVKFLTIDPSNVAIDSLFPSEKEIVENSIDKRQLEFAAGRLLSRKILNEFGCQYFPLLRDKHRIPIWPTNFIGSISHCENMCIAAVAHLPRTNLKNLGIDIEQNIPIQKSLWNKIVSRSEIDSLGGSDKLLGHQISLIFSTKEAIFKCLFPITRCWLDFKDIQIFWNNKENRFNINVIDDTAVSNLSDFQLSVNYVQNYTHIVVASELTSVK